MTRQEKVRQRKQTRFTKFKRFALVFFLILFLSVIAYAGYVGSQIYMAWNKIQSAHLDVTDQDWEEQYKSKRKKTEPFTILLLGVDNEGGKFVGRSDVLMLAIVNPELEKVSLLSIPRDTYTKIVGKGVYDKINHAYAYGIKTALDTVEHFLDVPIDYYMVVNFDGFRDFINVLGGLKIEAERDMYHHYVIDNITIDIRQGETVLNGDEALYYVRFRKDAEGDFGRNRRQQQVIRAVLDQTLDMRNVTKVADILEVVGDNFRTNIPATEILSMVRQFSSLSGDDVETLSFEADVGSIDGISYVFIDEEEQLRMQTELKRRLEPHFLTDTKHAKQSQGENY
ncbi:transcriptional regulator LytR [Caldalkalibacillus thermarum]|uniref:LCP family protein n=1 Tax=Caldalkalibacillus thermarum TaxID=296745 RepID=UPI001664EF46|nr:LCP family protein [Caldalkalibacillus thermarum]GGK33347.1 transcriptional regulator LytR [Caldalkalibacillus thermarum]